MRPKTEKIRGGGGYIVTPPTTFIRNIKSPEKEQ